MDSICRAHRTLGRDGDEGVAMRAGTPRASYDPLQRLDKRDLVQRIRALEDELETERQRRAGLAYDQQALLARILRLETDIILMQSERSH